LADHRAYLVSVHNDNVEHHLSYTGRCGERDRRYSAQWKLLICSDYLFMHKLDVQHTM